MRDSNAGGKGQTMTDARGQAMRWLSGLLLCVCAALLLASVAADHQDGQEDGWGGWS